MYQTDPPLPALADPDRLRRDARAGRHAIGHGLRCRLEQVLAEPVPQDWLDILNRAAPSSYQETT